MPRPTLPTRLLGLLLLVCIPAAGAALVLAQLELDRRAPSAEEWKELARQVRPRLKKGDLVRLSPGWDDIGRTAFHGATAGSGSFPFLAIDGRTPPDPILWMRFERVLLAGWAERLGAASELLPPGSAHVGEPGGTENLRAELWLLPPSPLRWSATDRLGEAKVRRLHADGKPVPCPARNGKFDCPGGPETWRDVRRVLSDVGDVPRDCIYAEPHPHGSTVEIAFDGVLAGAGDTLLLRAGNTIEAARRRTGGSLDVGLSVDGRRLAGGAFGRNDYLWTPWALRLPADAGPPTGRKLSITVRAERSGWRQVCVDLHVLGPGWEAWGSPGWGHAHRGKPAALSVGPESRAE